ncbi:MAG TPA: hypothetical protein VMA83_00715 [Solirubrobacteraceae bacterium]|nr:hypothetical protein [Solirubrobacteraceae bacterium]
MNYTAREAELGALLAHAARAFLRHPASLERLERAAAGDGRALADLVADSDGLVTDCHVRDSALDGWPTSRERLLDDREAAHPLQQRQRIREGRARMMSLELVELAATSLALRAVAREQLNAERAAGTGRHSRQREHAADRRDRGVGRADELAADELNARNGWSGSYARNAKHAQRAREDLAALRNEYLGVGDRA